MKRVALLGAVGGAGVTTLTAHLAAALAGAARPALAFDANPDNLLRLHFAMRWDDPAGFARALARGEPWQQEAYRSPDGADLVPFGELQADAELARLAALLSGQPDWLAVQLATLDLPQHTVALFDCARLPSPFTEQVLAVADLVLLVATPDAAAYAATQRLLQRLARRPRAPQPPLYLVLNQFDAAQRLHRDLAALLRTAQQAMLAPVLVHRDASVPESLACKQTTFALAPHSQAAHDLQALATWMLARLGRKDG